LIDLPRLGPRLIERRLDNGLRVVLLPDGSSSLVAINLWYHVGSKDDPPDRTGLAHLFEHMLFQGSQHVAANEHFQLVQRAGGSSNASTSFDRTNYYETLPSHCLELGLWLESDRLGFLLPALTEETFDGQRSVVLNERRERVENQPYGRAFETIQDALFPHDHPYGWPVIGYPEDIEAADLDDVKRFFRRFYNPANAVLTLVGGFEPIRAERLVNQYFGDIPPPESVPRPFATDAGRIERKEIVLEDEVALARTYLAWRCPEITSGERYAGEIMASVLSGGKSSPLYQDLVHQRQLAQDVTAFLLPMELTSTFLLVATAKPGVELSAIEARLAYHLTTESGGSTRAEDLERARNQVATGFFEDLQSVESLADLLSRSATFFEDPAAVDSEVSRYLNLQESELIDFSRRYLSPDSCVRLRVVPHGTGEGDE
jgi:zinc protease